MSLTVVVRKTALRALARIRAEDHEALASISGRWPNNRILTRRWPGKAANATYSISAPETASPVNLTLANSLPIRTQLPRDSSLWIEQ